MPEIKPNYKDDKPVCNEECYLFGEKTTPFYKTTLARRACGYLSVIGDVKNPCIPGLLQKLDKLKKERQENLRCSYCGKRAKEVWKLIANPIDDPARLYICDECSGLIVEILEKEKAAETDLEKG